MPQRQCSSCKKKFTTGGTAAFSAVNCPFCGVTSTAPVTDQGQPLPGHVPGGPELAGMIEGQTTPTDPSAAPFFPPQQQSQPGQGSPSIPPVPSMPNWSTPTPPETPLGPGGLPGGFYPPTGSAPPPQGPPSGGGFFPPTPPPPPDKMWAPGDDPKKDPNRKLGREESAMAAGKGSPGGGMNLGNVAELGTAWASAIGGDEAGQGAAEGFDKAMTVARAAAGDPVAMAQTVKMVVDDAKERAMALVEGAQGVTREAAGALSSSQAGDVAEHGFGMGEEAARAGKKFLGGPTMPFTEQLFAAGEKLMQFGKAISGTVEDIRKWNEQITQGNLRFAEFSAAMTQVQVEEELRAMRYSRERGNAQAQTAREQAEAKHRLEVALQPFETWWANFQNKTSTGISNFLTNVIDDISGRDRSTGDERPLTRQVSEGYESAVSAVGGATNFGRTGMNLIANELERYGIRDPNRPRQWNE